MFFPSRVVHFGRFWNDAGFMLKSAFGDFQDDSLIIFPDFKPPGIEIPILVFPSRLLKIRQIYRSISIPGGLSLSLSVAKVIFTLVGK